MGPPPPPDIAEFEEEDEELPERIMDGYVPESKFSSLIDFEIKLEASMSSKVQVLIQFDDPPSPKLNGAIAARPSRGDLPGDMSFTRKASYRWPIEGRNVGHAQRLVIEFRFKVRFRMDICP